MKQYDQHQVFYSKKGRAQLLNNIDYFRNKGNAFIGRQSTSDVDNENIDNNNNNNNNNNKNNNNNNTKKIPRYKPLPSIQGSIFQLRERNGHKSRRRKKKKNALTSDSDSDGSTLDREFKSRKNENFILPDFTEGRESGSRGSERKTECAVNNKNNKNNVHKGTTTMFPNRHSIKDIFNDIFNININNTDNTEETPLHQNEENSADENRQVKEENSVEDGVLVHRDAEEKMIEVAGVKTSPTDIQASTTSVTSVKESSKENKTKMKLVINLVVNEDEVQENARSRKGLLQEEVSAKKEDGDTIKDHLKEDVNDIIQVDVTPINDNVKKDGSSANDKIIVDVSAAKERIQEDIHLQKEVIIADNEEILDNVVVGKEHIEEKNEQDEGKDEAVDNIMVFLQDEINSSKEQVQEQVQEDEVHVEETSFVEGEYESKTEESHLDHRDFEVEHEHLDQRDIGAANEHEIDEKTAEQIVDGIFETVIEDSKQDSKAFEMNNVEMKVVEVEVEECGEGVEVEEYGGGVEVEECGIDDGGDEGEIIAGTGMKVEDEGEKKDVTGEEKKTVISARGGILVHFDENDQVETVIQDTSSKVDDEVDLITFDTPVTTTTVLTTVRDDDGETVLTTVRDDDGEIHNEESTEFVVQVKDSNDRHEHTNDDRNIRVEDDTMLIDIIEEKSVENTNLLIDIIEEKSTSAHVDESSSHIEEKSTSTHVDESSSHIDDTKTIHHHSHHSDAGTLNNIDDELQSNTVSTSTDSGSIISSSTELNKEKIHAATSEEIVEASQEVEDKSDDVIDSVSTITSISEMSEDEHKTSIQAHITDTLTYDLETTDTLTYDLETTDTLAYDLETTDTLTYDLETNTSADKSVIEGITTSESKGVEDENSASVVMQESRGDDFDDVASARECEDRSEIKLNHKHEVEHDNEAMIDDEPHYGIAEQSEEVINDMNERSIDIKHTSDIEEQEEEREEQEDKKEHVSVRENTVDEKESDDEEDEVESIKAGRTVIISHHTEKEEKEENEEENEEEKEKEDFLETADVLATASMESVEIQNIEEDSLTTTEHKEEHDIETDDSHKEEHDIETDDSHDSTHSTTSVNGEKTYVIKPNVIEKDNSLPMDDDDDYKENFDQQPRDDGADVINDDVSKYISQNDGKLINDYDGEKSNDGKRESPIHDEQLQLQDDDVVNQIFTEKGITAFFEIGEMLGDGNFAVVHRVFDLRTHTAYAMKIIDAPKIRGKEELLYNEIKIQRECHHPNLVKLYDDYHSPRDIYLVMELVRGGDFFDYISENEKLEEVEAAVYVRDMCSGIDYLHQREIVHRDIKPENLLVSHRLSLMLGATHNSIFSF